LLWKGVALFRILKKGVSPKAYNQILNPIIRTAKFGFVRMNKT